jgi:hypothetical protein
VKALIATPLIDGRADREFINGLIACHGLYHAWACLEGQSHICVARDLLSAQFLATDCDRLIFIDGDIGFARSDLERLLRAKQSLVSGLYPAKSAEMAWTFRPEGPRAATGAEHGGLVPVRYAPCGFLSIDRRVFVDLAACGSCPPYPFEGKTLNHFFQSGVIEGDFLSEDYFFCELARRAGHPPFVDPAVRLRHVGRSVFQRDN